jgi:hypothetical protein
LADYFPLIRGAVAALEPNTPETRRAFYDRARTAQLAELRKRPSIKKDFDRERLMLEDAISRVERTFSTLASADAPSRPKGAPALSELIQHGNRIRNSPRAVELIQHGLNPMGPPVAMLRLAYFTSFAIAVLLAVWMRSLGYGWLAALGAAVVVWLGSPFLISQLYAAFVLIRAQRRLRRVNLDQLVQNVAETTKGLPPEKQEEVGKPIIDEAFRNDPPVSTSNALIDKALTLFFYLWCGFAAALAVLDILRIIGTAPNLWAGIVGAQEQWFGPTNVFHWFAEIIFLSPAIGALMWRERRRERFGRPSARHLRRAVNIVAPLVALAVVFGLVIGLYAIDTFAPASHVPFDMVCPDTGLEFTLGYNSHPTVVQQRGLCSCLASRIAHKTWP